MLPCCRRAPTYGTSSKCASLSFECGQILLHASCASKSHPPKRFTVSMWWCPKRNFFLLWEEEDTASELGTFSAQWDFAYEAAAAIRTWAVVCLLRENKICPRKELLKFYSFLNIFFRRDFQSKITFLSFSCIYASAYEWTVQGDKAATSVLCQGQSCETSAAQNLLLPNRPLVHVCKFLSSGLHMCV